MPKSCSVEGCERNARSGGMCGKHYQRWRKHGDPLIKGLPRKTPPRTGFDHRPANVRFNQIHVWINKHYPRTGRCEYCGRTDRPTEYASDGHRYTRNRADWFEFCRACHKRFDTLSPESHARISAAAKARAARSKSY